MIGFCRPNQRDRLAPEFNLPVENGMTGSLGVPRLTEFRVGAVTRMTLAIWTFVFVNAIIADLSTHDPHIAANALRFVATASMGAVECFAIDGVLRRFIRRGSTLPLLPGICGVTVCTVAWSVSAFLIMHQGHLPPATASVDPTLAIWLYIVIRFWTFTAWLGAWFAIHFGREVAESEVRLAQAKSSDARARAHMLRDQLDPHFLFNSLNTIAALVHESDFDTARRATISLSKFLSLTLGSKATEVTTVDAEIKTQQHYVTIEQARLESRLQFETAIDTEALDCLIPSLILQPLVENAIKFGVMSRIAPVTVRVGASVTDQLLHLTVRDNGSRARLASGFGIGLPNVRSRLLAHYGERASLTTRSLSGGGFEAHVIMPAYRL